MNSKLSVNEIVKESLYEIEGKSTESEMVSGVSGAVGGRQEYFELLFGTTL